MEEELLLVDRLLELEDVELLLELLSGLLLMLEYMLLEELLLELELEAKPAW